MFHVNYSIASYFIIVFLPHMFVRKIIRKLWLIFFKFCPKSITTSYFNYYQILEIQPKIESNMKIHKAKKLPITNLWRHQWSTLEH